MFFLLLLILISKLLRVLRSTYCMHKIKISLSQEPRLLICPSLQCKTILSLFLGRQFNPQQIFFFLLHLQMVLDNTHQSSMIYESLPLFSFCFYSFTCSFSFINYRFFHRYITLFGERISHSSVSATRQFLLESVIFQGGFNTHTHVCELSLSAVAFPFLPFPSYRLRKCLSTCKGQRYHV